MTVLRYLITPLTFPFGTGGGAGLGGHDLKYYPTTTRTKIRANYFLVKTVNILAKTHTNMLINILILRKDDTD